MMPSVAILAGGLATRLHPITQTFPKALLDIAGKPFIAHQLALLKSRGVAQVVLCVGYLGERIQEVVEDGAVFGLKVDYSYDGPQLLGTGGAIKKALPLLSDPFFVLYGDSYLTTDFKLVVEAYHVHQKKGLMTVFRNEGKWDVSNIEYQHHTIIRYDKKYHTRDMHYIDYGLSLVGKICFERFAQEDVFDLTLVYQDLIQRGEMAGYEVKERFYEIGSFQGLEETKAHLMNSTQGGCER